MVRSGSDRPPSVDGERLGRLRVIWSATAPIEPSRLSQPATISSTFPASARGGPTDTVTTIGPIWIRSPSLSGVSLLRRSRPLRTVPLVLPRSWMTIPPPSRRSIAAWNLLTMGEARRNWQLRSRPITNRDPETATLRPFDAADLDGQPEPVEALDQVEECGTESDLMAAARRTLGRLGWAHRRESAGCRAPRMIADKISIGSVRGPDASGQGLSMAVASSA